MIKRARTARDFLDTFHSGTLEHRSEGEEPLLDVDFNEAFDYLYEINFVWNTRDIINYAITYIVNCIASVESASYMAEIVTTPRGNWKA